MVDCGNLESYAPKGVITDYEGVEGSAGSGRPLCRNRVEAALA